MEIAEKERKEKQDKKASTPILPCKQTKQPLIIINMQSVSRDCAAEIRQSLYFIFLAADTSGKET